jgi:DNA ligase (NAD+)
MQALEKLLQYHAWRYHTLDSPELSDEAYDALVREYQQLGGDYDSSVGVGAVVVDSLKKVQHKERQWSFDNIYDKTELVDWLEKSERFADASNIEYVCEQKIDGLKIVVEYDKGLMIRAITRGDGEVGEDVTHAVSQIQDIPKKISYKKILRVIGEVWLSKKDLESINTQRVANGEALYANSRNLAAGTLRQLDASVARDRNLHAFIYDIAFSDQLYETHMDELHWMQELGLPVCPYWSLTKNADEIERFYQILIQERQKYPYDIDGVVIKMNRNDLKSELGYTARTPRFAVAYKFPAEQSTSILRDVTVQTGRTGILTPVGHIDPVVIMGATIRKTTLHNQAEMDRLDLHYGDTVIVERAGDVIPKIIAVVKELRIPNAKKCSIPDIVKSQGRSARSQIDQRSGLVSWYNDDTETYEALIQQCMYAVSRSVLDMKGLGDETVRKLVEQGSITDIASIYELEAEDFESIEGFKEKSIQNALDSIEEAKTRTLDRLIASLGIRHVGAETARIIASSGISPEDVPKLSRESLLGMYGVGAIVANSFVEYFSNPEYVRLYQRLISYISIQQEKIGDTDVAWTGKTFVVTGTLEGFSRQEAEDAIRNKGGKVSSSVSKQTSIVVAGGEAGSKLKKAEDFGVIVWTENKFVTELKNKSFL